MKNVIPFIALVAVVVVPATSQADNIYGGYFSTNRYLHADSATRNAYVEGVLDGWLSAALMTDANVPLARKLSQCTVGNQITNVQATAIVDKYLENDPTLWSKSLTFNVFHAMSEACKRLGVPLE